MSHDRWRVQKLFPRLHRAPTSPSQDNKARLEAAPRLICSYCLNEDPKLFVEDANTADLICTRSGCGTVAQRVISMESEWRDFEEDTGRDSGNRIGHGVSIYKDADLSTQVASFTKGAGANSGHMMKAGILSKRHEEIDAEDPHNGIILQKITQMADLFDLDQAVRSTAKEVFYRFVGAVGPLSKHKLMKKIKDPLAAAVLFVACKHEGINYGFKEIARETNIDEKEIKRAWKAIDVVVPRPRQEANAAVRDVCARLGSKLKLPKSIMDLVEFVSDRAREHVEGKQPNTVAGATVSLVCNLVPDAPRITDAEIASLVSLSEGTIRSTRYQLFDVKEKLFPRDKLNFSIKSEIVAPSSSSLAQVSASADDLGRMSPAVVNGLSDVKKIDLTENSSSTSSKSVGWSAGDAVFSPKIDPLGKFEEKPVPADNIKAGTFGDHFQSGLPTFVKSEADDDLHRSGSGSMSASRGHLGPSSLGDSDAEVIARDAFGMRAGQDYHQVVTEASGQA